MMTTFWQVGLGWHSLLCWMLNSQNLLISPKGGGIDLVFGLLSTTIRGLDNRITPHAQLWQYMDLVDRLRNSKASKEERFGKGLLCSV